MPRWHPDARAQQGAPQRPPGERARRRAAPLPPGWPPCEAPAGGAGRPGGWRAPVGSEWWPASGGEAPPRRPPPRLPPLPAAAPRPARRPGLRSLLLPPPRVPDKAPWTRVHPEPGECRADGRGLARDPGDLRDSLGALLGQLLPSKFQTVLRQLGAHWAEKLEAQSEARGVPVLGLGGAVSVGQAHRLAKNWSC